jgi:hypothetical protein
MDTVKFLDFDCVPLGNKTLSLLITQSVGPRIISLRFNGGDNLFAELPDFVAERPDGETYHFYGGHRLWHAPEHMPRSYALDDAPVKIEPIENGFSITKPIETETGIGKSMQVSLVEDKPRAIIQHTLTNHNLWPVECAPWAITQFKTGGVAILPQPQEQSGLLPNRSLALWPYADVSSPHVVWGNKHILLHAEMQNPFKIGFPNPRGWLAYWLNGTLFVKHADYDAHASYYDFGSSSECYCNDQVLELETLAPVGIIESGGMVSHAEIWDLYKVVDPPHNENEVQSLAERLGLE